MDYTWLKLYRKSVESRVFKNPNLWKVWTWCLMKAAYRERWVTVQTGRTSIEVKVEPGQFVFGRFSAADELGMKPSSVWKRMQKLQKLENLNINSDIKYSLITIINWESYQGLENNCDSNGDSGVTAEEQSGDTNKKVKKVKKVKKETYIGSPLTSYQYPDWLNKTLWQDFHRMRSRIKKPITTARTITGLLNKLEKLVSEGHDQDELIQNAVDHCWQSFYPPKKERVSGNGKYSDKTARTIENLKNWSPPNEG